MILNQIKEKAFKDVNPKDHMYHRMAVSAEMAKLRVDMAYIVDRIAKMETVIAATARLHQRVDILEAAYGYQKMLAEKSRIEYALIAKGLEDIKKLKEELSNEAKQSSNGTDGAKG